jgi:hypothetical protein
LITCWAQSKTKCISSSTSLPHNTQSTWHGTILATKIEPCWKTIKKHSRVKVLQFWGTFKDHISF